MVSAHAGILVYRSDKGIQFADAVAITANGKDKALSMGAQPALSGVASKLPSGRFGGTMLRDADTGILLEYEGGKADYLLPQGLPKTAPTDPSGMWKASKVIYKLTASDKAGTEIPVDNFIAYLPNGVEELTQLCVDPQALLFIGGKGKGFPTQVELMSAAVKAYAANPALAPMEKRVEDSMRRPYEAFENGAGGVDVLNQGLQFVQLSNAVYPNAPEQDKLRKALTNRKAWLDRRIAVQKAFAAANQWDAFLLGDRDLQRYRQYFPEIEKAYSQALQGSLQLHSTVAMTRQSEGDFGAAYREYRLAGLRKPSDPALREQAMQAWTEYSRRHAMELQSKRVKIGAGPQSAVERDLFFAEQNKLSKKLDEALKNVLDAEAVLQAAQPAGAVSNTSLKVWYTKADVLAAQERFTEAVATLDAYDLNAVDEERNQADKLRNQLLFSLNSSLKNIKARVQTAWADGNFSFTEQLASQGLRMANDDADLLYYAGLSALVKRDGKAGRDLLTHYLEVTNTLDSNAEQRALVSALLPTANHPAAAAKTGDANWLSGANLPKGVFYCPMSLAFQPHIDRVDASNKFHLTFEWAGEQLRSINPTFENVDKATGEKKVTFTYYAKLPQVAWASDGDQQPPAASADNEELYKRAVPLLFNNPSVDPLAVQRITGKNIAVTVAGNRFFNPFVWEKLYYYRLTYDDMGRVTHAQEISGPRGLPGEQTLDFEWSGSQLMAIRGFVAKNKNYERTMQYQDGLLVGEEIQGQGKPSKIKYTYVANRLVAAEAATDGTLDNRSRKVSFAANSATTQVK